MLKTSLFALQFLIGTSAFSADFPSEDASFDYDKKTLLQKKEIIDVKLPTTTIEKIISGECHAQSWIDPNNVRRLFEDEFHISDTPVTAQAWTKRYTTAIHTKHLTFIAPTPFPQIGEFKKFLFDPGAMDGASGGKILIPITGIREDDSRFTFRLQSEPSQSTASNTFISPSPQIRPRGNTAPSQIPSPILTKEKSPPTSPPCPTFFKASLPKIEAEKKKEKKGKKIPSPSSRSRSQTTTATTVQSPSASYMEELKKRLTEQK